MSKIKIDKENLVVIADEDYKGYIPRLKAKYGLPIYQFRCPYCPFSSQRQGIFGISLNFNTPIVAKFLPIISSRL